MSTSNTSNMNLNLNYNMDEAKFIINEKFNTTNAYKLLKITNLLDAEAANKLKKYIGLAKDGEVKVEYTVNSIGRLEIAAIPSKGKNPQPVPATVQSYMKRMVKGALLCDAEFL